MFRRKISPIFLCLIITSLLWVPSLKGQRVNNAENAALAKIENHIVTDIHSEIGNIKSYDNNVDSIVHLLRKDGSFDLINYADKSVSIWEPSNHLKNILAFATAYSFPKSKYYRSQPVYSEICQSLRYWNRLDPICPNWWFNEINCPQILGQIMLLMNAEKPLPKELQDSLINKMKRGDMYKQKGANKIDIAMHNLYQALLVKDTTLLSAAVGQCFEPIAFTTKEGIQYDYSYFQHGPQLQISSYGLTLLVDEYKIAAYLRNTRWKISAEKEQILNTFFKDVYLKTLRGKYSDFNVLGRRISRINFVDARPAIDAHALSNVLLNAQLVDPKDSLFYQNTFDKVYGNKSPSYQVKPQNIGFWIGGYMLHIRPGYLFSVRCNSVRTYKTESGNGENLLARTMSDGATNIQRNGDEYYNIFPLWEYDKIPGVTCRDYPNDLPQIKQWGYFGSTSFVGEVSDGLYGASVYVQNFDSVKAQKGYFFFDKYVVCLGSGIQSNAPENITTTVNQSWLRSRIFTSKGLLPGKDNILSFLPDKNNWLWQDSIGYYFPKGGNLEIKQTFEKGNWNNINNSFSKEDTVSGNVFKAWFNHGSKIKNGRYAYIVAPAIGLKEMKQSTMKVISIVDNNESVQAVYNNNIKILQAIFYKAGEINYKKISLSVDKPCILLLKKSTNGSFLLSIADPTHLLKSINIQLNNKKIKCILPAGNFAGKTLQYNIGIL